MSKYLHITDYLDRSAQKLPKKPAIVDGQISLSWSELKQQVDKASQQLSKLVRSEESQLVSILIPNTWEFVVAYLAILNLGHTAVPIDVIYKQLEIDAIINQMNPVLVITDETNFGRTKTNHQTVLLKDLAKESNGAIKKIRQPVNEQIATIFFTSGTTGKPKAVPNTHLSHMWNIDVCSQVWQWTEADSLLLSIRLSHWYGAVMGLAGALYHGNTLYLQDRFSPQETLEQLSSGKISLFTHGPIAYSRLIEVDNWQAFDLSKVRLFISGSGPLSPSLWQDFKDRFGQEILEVYGSSETGRIASNLLGERLPGSPGRPLPEVDLKFGDDGEVLVKSPAVISGYYRNPALTKQAFTADGYWKTGDIGELVDGRIMLKGRHSEIIRKQGYTVSPRDVEWAVNNHPKVKEVAVVGQHQPGNPNDKIVYFISGEVTEPEILAFVKDNLPSVWRPDKIVLLDQIPKTDRGKVNIPALRTML